MFNQAGPILHPRDLAIWQHGVFCRVHTFSELSFEKYHLASYIIRPGLTLFSVNASKSRLRKISGLRLFSLEKNQLF